MGARRRLGCVLDGSVLNHLLMKRQRLEAVDGRREWSGSLEVMQLPVVR